MKLILIGNKVEIEGLAELTQFGQAIDVDEKLGRDLRSMGTMLYESEFNTLGFTAEEMAQYAEPWTHSEAPESFKEKKARALAAAQSEPMTSTPKNKE